MVAPGTWESEPEVVTNLQCFTRIRPERILEFATLEATAAAAGAQMERRLKREYDEGPA
jgi:hypothetical protein